MQRGEVRRGEVQRVGGALVARSDGGDGPGLSRPRGRELLAALAGELLGLPPDGIEIDASCPDCGLPHGAPRVVGAPRLGATVAHAGAATVVAVGDGIRVGVDAEPSAQDPARLAAIASLLRLPPDSEPAALLRAWTTAEAVLKADGRGLRVDPARVRVDGDRAVIDNEPGAAYRLVPLDLGPDLVITLATGARP